MSLKISFQWKKSESISQTKQFFFNIFFFIIKHNKYFKGKQKAVSLGIWYARLGIWFDWGLFEWLEGYLTEGPAEY